MQQRQDESRARAIALLESQHAFPGPFEFRVVIPPAVRSAVIGAVVSSVGGGEAVLEVSERASSNGTYVSVRVRVRVERAEAVLDIYEVLRGVEGVLTIL